MNFKEWIKQIEESGWISNGKAEPGKTAFIVGPKRFVKPRPHNCGVGGGAGPCNGATASGGMQ